MDRLSTGILRYEVISDIGHKVYLEIDPDITRLARALIPKYFNVKQQRFLPHITIVRKESICDMTIWGWSEGEEIPFEYDSYVHNDEEYFWLNVNCHEAKCIRRGLGLNLMSETSKPPDGSRCFHTTVGNTK